MIATKLHFERTLGTGLDVINSHHPSCISKKWLYKEMEPLSDAGNSKPLSPRKPRSLKSPVLLAAVPAVPLCVCVSCCTKQVTHF